MYQLYDIEMWREHHSGLLREAQQERLARQLRSARPKGWSRSASALGFLAALVVAVLMLVGLSSPAHADTTFTVTSTADPGNGVCDLACTLREAITAANDTPGKDTINFRLSNTGEVRTIFPTSNLPTITEAVTIDGYTQSGASPNTLAKGTNAKIMVELDGSLAGVVQDGLRIVADDVVVRGLAINRFDNRGILVSGADVSGVKVEGNFIGTDPTGALDLGNRLVGVVMGAGGGNNTVGGTTPEARNLISGNGASGVSVSGEGVNRVQGNLIGTSKDGKSPLGNGSTGVIISGANDNLVGGPTLGSANTIAFNGGDGVEIGRNNFGDVGTGNPILANSIFSNGGLGIDLAGGTENAAGATANDPGDVDAGANGLQNKPIIASAVASGGKTTIKGKLSSKPNTTFMVRFYANPSGGDEGKKSIGQKKVTTNSEGKVSFTFSPAQKVGVGKTVTATATGPEGTSEFSAPRTVASA